MKRTIFLGLALAAMMWAAAPAQADHCRSGYGYGNYGYSSSSYRYGNSGYRNYDYGYSPRYYSQSRYYGSNYGYRNQYYPNYYSGRRSGVQIYSPGLRLGIRY